MLIKSSKTLCADYEAVTRLSKESGEPIFITKDGEGDMVLLPLELYERSCIQQPRFPAEKQPPLKTQLPEQKEGIRMTEYELGQELRNMYDKAPRGAQVVFIHLFGIRYASDITDGRLDKKQILRAAGLPESYQTEISKGMNLAKYVTSNPDVVF